MPQTMSPGEERAWGDGREALIRAAIGILSEQGLRGISHRTVADRAGVAHGLVRHHFHTLNELIRAAADQAAAESITLSTLEPGTGVLDDLAAALPGHVARDPGSHAMSYEIARAGLLDEELGAVVKKNYDEYVAATARELGRAGLGEEDDALARVVFAALDGLVLQQLVRGIPGELESGIDRLRKLLRGLN